MTAIRFEVLGEQRVWGTLTRVEEEAADMRAPLTEAGHILEDLAARQFESQGVYALGHPWAPLSPRYAARKMLLYGPRPILVATGKMRRLLTEDGIRELTQDTLVYGTFDDVANWHQSGTSKMPARPIIVVTEREQHEIDAAFQAWVAGLIDRGPRYLPRDVRGRFR